MKGSDTVRQTHKVRVYWQGDVLYGCVRRSGLTRKLFGGPPYAGNEYPNLHLVRIAGFHVAFTTGWFCTVCGQAGPSSAIEAVELRSGRHRVLSPVRKAPDNSGTWVDALVLDRCGRIAYRAILSDSWRMDEDPHPELHTWVGKTRRRIDRGPIRRDSIHLEPSSVHWVNGEFHRSAPLAPAC